MIQFIARIRAGDEKTKWKWLIIFTTLSTLIVIVVWILALRSIKADIELVAIPPQSTVSPADDRSLLETLKAIASEIGKRTSIAAQTIRSKIKGNSIELVPIAAPTETSSSSITLTE
jgi:hypothetical protein